MGSPTFRSVAKRRWPKAEWIDGNGPWALLAHCGGLTVCLRQAKSEAEDQKAQIDKTGCGAHCSHEHGHEIVFLELPSKTAKRSGTGGRS